MTFNKERLEKIIRKYMRKGKVPGLAISITKDDEIIYSKGFGSRDLEKNLPMTPDTLIGIGSCTKSFTAFAIMKLVEQGKLCLDDSASKYLDVPPFSNHPDMKIKHLLSHSTGVPASDAGLFPFFYNFGEYQNIIPMSGRDDFFAHIGGAEDFIIFKPGEKFFYQNDMYVSLGYIIEQLSRDEYADFVQKEILGPLEMNRAVYTKENFGNDPKKNVMSGYMPKMEGEKMSLQKKDAPLLKFLHAGGGLYASMNEMMYFCQCLLNQGTYKEQQLLTPESIKQIWTPIIGTPYGYTEDTKYAFGWCIDEDYYPQKIIHHGGGLGTSCAWLALIPDLNIGISIAQNCCTANTSVIGRAALSLLLNLDPMEHEQELRVGKIIEEIEGNYKSSYDLYSFMVKLKGSIVNVHAEIDDGPMDFPIILKNETKLEFLVAGTVPDSKNVIKFMRNPDSGKIEYVTFDRYLYRRV